ncbi:hypothetical protein SAY86_027028 [Trapa natans]|uniref:Glutamate--cysteine ligase, chloroplastic n=1 Tax=Trapa natans TaxID=22666 RepID=A0AAN7KQG5_TRANT|nr:hypothetical protein SAY86_027028 [Trapa natans]
MALMSHTTPSSHICNEIVQFRPDYNANYGMVNRVLSFMPPCQTRAPLGLHAGSALVRFKRGGQFTVAASPPTEDVAVAAEPLTKEDLVGYLASGCKPKEKWRIGTEHEKFGFEIETLRPMKYDQIAELLNSIAERFDWEKVMEGDNIIGLKQGKQSISLEPGGQFELSGAPLETLHQTCAEVNSHLYQVKAVAEEMGIGFLGIGFQPKWGRKDIPIMPKGRYDIMRNYMPKVGSLGLDMMLRTCTVQVNLDFSSEADMIRKFRAGLALQPIATALFANSPFTEGKPNGYLSMRSHIWSDTDNNRTGMLPFVFDESFGFEQYVDYALDVPMYFVYRNKKYIDCTGMSFRDFMAGKLLPIPGEFPNLNDWENHLTTIFPEVRLKRYLEMRGADGGPWRRLCALPAFWVGILYDEDSLQSVLDMTADWTPQERQMLRSKVPKTGLRVPFRDGFVKHIAEDVIKLAKEGLERRGFKETGFLNAVADVVRTGVTPAENLLEMYNAKWGQSVDPVFEELFSLLKIVQVDTSGPKVGELILGVKLVSIENPCMKRPSDQSLDGWTTLQQSEDSTDMGMEFHVLEPPKTAKIRLLGVDITVERQPPVLIDFLGVQTQSCHGHNRWKIVKHLFLTDVGSNWGHLQLPKADVKAHILAAMDEEMVRALRTPGKSRWLRVRLVDDDKGTVYDGMKLTYYSSSKGYVLNGSWNKMCKNRCLQVNDKVGLYWDPNDKTLHFSIRERAPSHRDHAGAGPAAKRACGD